MLRFTLILTSICATVGCGAASTPTAQASLEAVTAAAVASATAPGGIPVLASPIELMIPSGLASTANAEPVDAVALQAGAAWDVAPAHLQITLIDYSLQGSFHVPQVFVYPRSEYAAANPGAAESVKRLQALLTNANGPNTGDSLPHIPFFNAGQALAAQVKLIQFSGGSGIRAVVQYAQDVSPINNGGLFYLFQGLSQDGKYYVIAILPTSSPYLPRDNNPEAAVPAGGIPFPAVTASGSSFEAYYTQTTQLLDHAASSQFDPSLDTLDALVKSISIQP